MQTIEGVGPSPKRREGAGLSAHPPDPALNPERARVMASIGVQDSHLEREGGAWAACREVTHTHRETESCTHVQKGQIGRAHV